MVFWFLVSLRRRGAVIVNILNALVATVRFGIGVFFEMDSRVLEEPKVMSLAKSKVGAYNLTGFLIDR